MSKKTSKKNSSDTLDENFQVEESKAPVTPSGKDVDLKDFIKDAPYAFNQKNYKMLLIGLGINVLGFILMMGGGADSPDEFNADELFSHVRITIAPMFIVLGYAVIMYAIMKKPKKNIQ